MTARGLVKSFNLRVPGTRRSPHNILQKEFQFNLLNSALSQGIGKVAGPEDTVYPLLKKLPVIGRLALLDTMNQVWQTGALIPDEWKEEWLFLYPRGKGQDVYGALWTSNLRACS